MATRYWVRTGGGNWNLTDGVWATSSGGPETAVFANGDTAVFDANSGSGTITLTTSISVVNLTITNALSGLAFATSGGNTLSISSTTPAISRTSAAISIPFPITFTSTAVAVGVFGAITFLQTVTLATRSSAGISVWVFTGDVVFTTLTIPTRATGGTHRIFLRSGTLGAQRTLAVDTFTGTNDLDFRDIAITGTASPISQASGATYAGFGDCGNNAGITFRAAATRYIRGTTTAVWSSTSAWSDVQTGGTVGAQFFPLAQDTVVVTNSAPNTGATSSLSPDYNIGTVDMTARTNAITFSITGDVSIYKDFKLGSGVTMSGTGKIIFSGRNATQQFLSAGKTYTQECSIEALGSTVQLQDAYLHSGTAVIEVLAGTLDLNGYSFVTAGTFSTTGTQTRAINFNGGSLQIASGSSVTTPWTATSTGLSMDGNGQLLVSSASVGARTFSGGDFQNYPDLVLGANILGSGFTINGSNKFNSIYVGPSGFVFSGYLKFQAGTTNEFTNFPLTGISAANNIVLSSTSTVRAILKKPSTWYMGANSVDVIGNLNLTFTAGDGIDYFNVSYIEGQTGGATVYNVSVLESALGVDAETVAAQFAVYASETLFGADTVNAAAQYISNTVELVSGADALAATVEYPAGVLEATSSADSVSATAEYPTSVAETASSAASDSADDTTPKTIVETASAVDSVSALTRFGAAVAEAAAGAASDSADETTLKTMAETASAVDSVSARRPWEPVDDSQTANWQNVSNPQSSSWTDVPNSQSPGWTDI